MPNTQPATRFGFTKKHYDLLRKVVKDPYSFVADAKSAATVAEKWGTLPTETLLTAEEFDTYTDGAHKLETIKANVTASCSEAQVCKANGFPTTLLA